jgi:hypothetical protein
MSDITELSANADWWSVVDHWAVAIVFIGVVVEGIAEWLPRQRRETMFWTRVTRSGWLVLVLALAVEYVAQKNKDADDALIVGSMNDAAAQLSKDAELAKRQTARLQQDNLSLQGQVADAQKAALDAQIEEERIKGAVVWRLMKLNECQAALNAVSTTPRTLVVRFIAGDAEAQLYATSIAKCFENTGRWNVSAASLTLASAAILGLSVEGTDTVAVAAIRAALANAGLSTGEMKLDPGRICSICGNSDRPENPDVLITVGSRPVISP